MNPFFSVCIPASGRSKTILRCIESILNQSFRDIELIVTTRNDKLTYDLVYNYLNNKNIDFKYYVENIESNYINAEDWNDPILKSNGLYISMLEGDDFFESNHLKIAYEILSKNNNINLFVSSTNRSSCSQNDKIYSNNEFYKTIYTLKAVPAPSEVIFKRINNSNTLNLYNVSLFYYAPEIDLYLKILSENSFVYKSSFSTVYREPSSKPYDRIHWILYRDHLIVLFKYFGFNNFNYFLLGLYNIALIYCKCLILFILWKLNLK
jgi:glycosyltransferase involved in cell wall biosynthesis